MTHGGGGRKAHIVVTYRMKIEDALEKATLASLPIMTPSGSLDLMMRWIAAEGKDISSGTGLTCSISLASPFLSSAARSRRASHPGEREGRRGETRGRDAR